MYEYIRGKMVSLEPTQVVIDCGGVGYLIEITLNTYEWLQRQEDEMAKLYVHHVVREDAQQLYGFAEMAEREMFRLLITISGVGNQTARVMLSSLTVEDLRAAIVAQDAKRVQKVKGIGAKTAQRIVIELADKVGGLKAGSSLATSADTQARDEAMTALTMLGFAKPAVEKLLMSDNWAGMTVEEIIKEGLKRL